MEPLLRARQARAFAAFANGGDHITFESYTGQARRLAELRGQDPETPSVAALTQQLEEMWDQFSVVADTDQDGRVSSDEYHAYAEIVTALVQASPSAGWVLDPYIRRLFDVIDADSDGRITLQEYADWLASLGLADDTDIEGAFASFDTNGDGTLSWEEFSLCGRNYFTQADIDVPGARWMGP